MKKRILGYLVKTAKKLAGPAMPRYRALRGTLRVARLTGVSSDPRALIDSLRAGIHPHTKGSSGSEKDAPVSFSGIEAQFLRPILPMSAFQRQRILLTTGSLSGGGAERQVAILGAALARDRRLPVEVLCKHVGGPFDLYKDILDRAGVAVTGLASDPGAPYADALKLLYYSYQEAFQQLPPHEVADILALADEFLKRRPGVVHCYLDEPSVKAGLAGAMVGVPIIVLSWRNVIPEQFVFYKPYWKAAYLALVRCPRVRLTNNSRPGAADYARWLQLPPERIRVIPNGIDTSVINRPAMGEVESWAEAVGIAPGRMVVGAAMRLSEEKRPLLWVATAAAIARQRPDVAFLAVGEGPMFDDMRRLARQLGIADRLFLPGLEPRVALALARMDVFLLTSRAEGLPNVLIEAQALGVPVVTTSVGGAPDTLDEGRTGWSVLGADPDSLADRVLWVLDHPEWRQEARVAAPPFVLEKFAVRRMVDETLAVYGLDGEAAADQRSQSLAQVSSTAK